MPLGAAARGGEPVGQSLEHEAEGLEETRRDALARQRLADSQAQRERGLARHGTQPLERAEGAAGSVLERERRHAHRAGTAAWAPAGADQASRRRPQGACEPALRARGEPLGRRPHRTVGIGGSEREHTEGGVARHQHDTRHARRLHVGLAQPGPGWHVLPRRLEAERPKKVAKIVDPLGAGEQLAQHHGPLTKEGAMVRGPASKTGTGLARRGPEFCGKRPGKREGGRVLRGGASTRGGLVQVRAVYSVRCPL